MTETYENAILRLQPAALGPWETNTYTVTCRATGESLVIDAPGEPERVVEMLQGTKPRYILLTHTHPDHVLALPELKSLLNVPVAVHPLDAVGAGLEPDILLNDGDKVKLGNRSIEVLHTPGHTPGSCCFLADGFLLAGDTVFPGGPGHTDGPEAFLTVIRSITERILPLPPVTPVLPGHGVGTTVEEVKAEYEDFASRLHPGDLCGDVLWAES